MRRRKERDEGRDEKETRRREGREKGEGEMRGR